MEYDNEKAWWKYTLLGIFSGVVIYAFMTTFVMGMDKKVWKPPIGWSLVESQCSNYNPKFKDVQEALDSAEAFLTQPDKFPNMVFEVKRKDMGAGFYYRVKDGVVAYIEYLFLKDLSNGFCYKIYTPDTGGGKSF